MNQQLMQEYMAAFKAANPGKTLPTLSYSRGYYRFLGQRGIREERLIEMRDVLRSRVAKQS